MTLGWPDVENHNCNPSGCQICTIAHLRRQSRDFDAKALLWRAVADRLAGALRECTVPGPSIGAMRHEALGYYEVALIDGSQTQENGA